MSREDKKRQQAQNLLRALTDIDDRFLEEALRDDQSLDAAIGKDKNLETAFVYNPDKVQVKLPGVQTEQDGRPESGKSENGRPESGRPESSRPESSRPERSKPESTKVRATDISEGNVKRRSGKLRRYSSWALTAAACLTVVLVGRYVSVNHVTTDVKSTSIESEQKPDISQAVPETRLAEEAAESVLQAQPSEEAAEDYAKSDFSQELNASGEAAGEAADSFEESMAGADRAAEDSILGLANPFVEVQTVEDAETAAGFKIRLPGMETPYDTVIYRVIPGKMIEVIYFDNDGTEGCRIRKAADTQEDISGDSTIYAREDVLKAKDGTLVQVKGDEDQKWSLACWSRQGDDKKQYSFALIAGKKEFSSEEVLDIVSSTNEID